MTTTMTNPERIPRPEGGTLKAALALPSEDVGEKLPGVVVLHEIYGLNDDIRNITSRFADAGYAAIAPDLYSHGNKALCLTRVLVDGSRGRGATFNDIEAARAHLAAHPRVDENRLAIIGFCLGGGFALAFAASGTKGDAPVQAVSINYGTVPKDRSKLESVCPVVGSYGALDKIFAPHAKRLEDHLTALGVPHDVKLYPDAGHAFIGNTPQPRWAARLPNPMSPAHSEPEAKDAWARILAFFAEHV